jgi:hypothetical protein
MAHEHYDSGRHRRKAHLRPEAVGSLLHEALASLVATRGPSPRLSAIDDAVERLLAPVLPRSVAGELHGPPSSSPEEIDVARRRSDYLGSLRCLGPRPDRRNAERDHTPRHPSCRHVPSPGLLGGRNGLGCEAHAEVTAGRDPRGGGSPQRRCLRRMGRAHHLAGRRSIRVPASESPSGFARRHPSVSRLPSVLPHGQGRT